MRSRNIVVLIAPFLLSACYVQSKVQGQYVADQKECQKLAEQNIDRYLPQGKPVTVADRNAQMVVLFSDCMGRVGWQVAKPKKADEVASTAPNGSPNYPVGYPSTTTARVPPEPTAVTASPAGQQVPMASPETTPMSPAGVVPPPSPMNTPPAVYQPMYGTGPGRNF